MGKRVHIREDIYYKGERMPHRQCTICREWKPFEMFYLSKQSSIGIQSRCKSCSNKLRVQWRQKKTGIVGRRYPKVARKVLNKASRKVEMQRKCSDCHTWKSFSLFHVSNRDKWGVGSICKECLNNRRINNYQKYKEEGNESYWRTRVRRINDLCKGRWETKGQLDFKVVKESFDNKCHYCGDEITHQEAHVDHIEPLSKGGDNTHENTTFACKTCNMMKYNLNPVDFASHMKKILNHMENTEITSIHKKKKYRRA